MSADPLILSMNRVAYDELLSLRCQNEKLKTKISNQRKRLSQLEGATNHAEGTPLSKALAEIETLKTKLDLLIKLTGRQL